MRYFPVLSYLLFGNFQISDSERPAKAARDQDARVHLPLRGREPRGAAEEGGEAGETGGEAELFPGGGQPRGHHRRPQPARDDQQIG